MSHVKRVRVSVGTRGDPCIVRSNASCVNGHPLRTDRLTETHD